MNLRRKTLVTIGITFSLMFLSLGLLAHQLLVARFTKLEAGIVYQDTARAAYALQNILDALTTLATDNGKWDDTYTFMTDPTPTYIENVVIDSAQTNHLNLWLLLNSDGVPVVAKEFNRETGEEIPLSPALARQLAERSLPLQSYRLGGNSIIWLPDCPLLIGFHSIQPTNGSGESRGTLVVGRYLDAALLRELEANTKLTIEISPARAAAWPTDGLLKATLQAPQIEISPLNDRKIRGSFVLPLENAIPLAGQITMERSIYQEGLHLVQVILYALAALFLLFSLVMLGLLDKMLLRRLVSLSQTIRSIRNHEDCQQQISVSGNDELASLGKSINRMLRLLDHSFSRLQHTNQALGNLLNNTEQGIVTFGDDLLIHPAYSQECLRFFPGSVSGHRLSELLYPGQADNAETGQFFDHACRRILRETNEAKRAVFLSLLPEEATVGSIVLSLHYKLIFSAGTAVPQQWLMVIMTDMTEKKQLELTFNQERTILKMALSAGLHYNDLAECIHDYRDFCRHELPEILARPVPPGNRLAEVLHNIHTLKGKFSQFNLLTLVQALHDLEDQLLALRAMPPPAIEEKLPQLLDSRQLSTWLEADVRTLRRFLGDTFFQHSHLQIISQQQLLQIEKKVLQRLPRQETRWLLPELRQLRYKPFRDLLKTYPEYTAKLADRFGKQLNTLIIEGGDQCVNPAHYRRLVNALVHIVKNAIEHGLETPAERLAAGKPEQGTLRIRINGDAEHLCLRIHDDGRGIDLSAVKAVALAHSLFPAATLDSLSAKELTELLFTEYFTTQETVSLDSGRGIGLSAIKREVDRLHGTIEIESSPGQGTTFFLRIPYYEETIPAVTPHHLLQVLHEQALAYLATHADVIIGESTGLTEEPLVHVALPPLTACILLRGPLPGLFLLGLPTALAKEIAASLPPGVLAAIPEPDQLASLASECANVILGNGLAHLGPFGKQLSIGTPLTLSSEDALLRLSLQEVWRYPVATDRGVLLLAFLPLSTAPE